MRRPVDPLTLLLVVLASVLVAGCAMAPTASPQGGAPATDGASEGVQCAITQPPGPGDAPSVDAEIDTTSLGPGRWRICLTIPTALTLENSAWCHWDAEGNQVDDMSGLPTSNGPVDYDVFLAPPSDFQIHLTDRAQNGLIANYTAGPGDLTIATESTMRGGLAVFEAGLEQDPEAGSPPGAPPVVSGAMRWECGDPPPT